MFMHTLPAVAITLPIEALPKSNTVTSFFLPKVAEQGFGVPVRSIRSNYAQALQERISAILTKSERLSHELDAYVRRENTGDLRKIDFKSSQWVRDIRHQAELTARGDFIVDEPTMESLLYFLYRKEENDTETAGLTIPHGMGVEFSRAQIPYLRLLHGLEIMGVIRGIVYEYDRFVGGRRSGYYDIRTIDINPERFYDIKKELGHPEKKVLMRLKNNRNLDFDAEPLYQFFQEAYRRNSVVMLSGYTYQKESKKADFYVGGRTHAVGAMTIVRAMK